jgi:hypothetical protein
MAPDQQIHKHRSMHSFDSQQSVIEIWTVNTGTWSTEERDVQFCTTTTHID